MNATEKTSYRICPLCEACCGLEIKTAGTEILSIRGDDADVFSRGYICPKAVALKDLHEDPDRLRTPMIKRDGQFVQATWTEAFALIEAKLPALQKSYGKHALAVTVGNPGAHKIGLLGYFSRLARALSSRNIFSASTLDQMPKQLSAGLMFGTWMSVPVPDIDHTDLLIVIGGNPMVSNGSMWTVPDFRGKAKALKARGGKLIVIDPRRTETAAMADQYIAIRPGTDVFLLAAIANTIFTENLVRLRDLQGHINGLDEAATALAPFTAQAVAARCHIDASIIQSLARQMGKSNKAALYGRIGTCTQSFGTSASWLIDVINTITGHLDHEGGAMFAKAAAFGANTAGQSGQGKGVVTGRHHSRVSNAPEVFGELPINLLCEEIETAGDSQIKALITIASNPVLSAPNGARLSKALEALEFMVSLDIYINETTRHADVILPGLSALEEPHYDIAFPQLSYRNHARYSPAVFEPNAQHIPEWLAIAKLAEIVGGDRAEKVPRPEEMLDQALQAGPYGLTLDAIKAQPHGIDLGALQPRIPEVLRTASGKIELAPPSLIADMNRALTDLNANQPAHDLVVIGRRQVRSNNSWMHNLPTLAKGPFRCTALIHSSHAARLKLVNGGMARLAANSEQTIDVQVEISDDMMPGVISVPHGWGHNLEGSQLSVASQRPGANLNALLNLNDYDPLSGNAVLNGIAVTASAIA